MRDFRFQATSYGRGMSGVGAKRNVRYWYLRAYDERTALHRAAARVERLSHPLNSVHPILSKPTTGVPTTLSAGLPFPSPEAVRLPPP